MSFTQELRARYDHLWFRLVIHPFVIELGDGTLPPAKFRDYLLQDYVFVKDLVALIALGISKAPDFDAANRLNRFLSDILNPENDLFVRAFGELGVSEETLSSTTASPTMQGFGDFLLRAGLEGDFGDILTVLYVTEATYLDWATRLIQDGKRPANGLYREWIDIHGPDVLGDLVSWMGHRLDGEGRTARRDHLFLTALRYEYMFWESVYHGESWAG